MSVSMMPGQNAFTVIASRATSLARLWVMPTTPNLLSA